MLTQVQAPPEPYVRVRSSEIERVEQPPPSFDDDPIVFWLVQHTLGTVALLENLVLPFEQ